MKSTILLCLLALSTCLQAQRLVPFNNATINADTIRKLQIREEIANIFAWEDSITPLETKTTEYDTVGNMIRQTITGSIYPQGSVLVRKFDSRNRMTEEAWYYYPDIPKQRNTYLFNDLLQPRIMQATTVFYESGKPDNTVTNIAIYNDKGGVVEYKSINAQNQVVLHMKYALDNTGKRSSTMIFFNDDKDSSVQNSEEEYALPFHDLVNSAYSIIKTDTIRFENANGCFQLHLYESLPDLNNQYTTPQLVAIQKYYPNGLLMEERKLQVRVAKYVYEFWSEINGAIISVD